MSIAKNIETIRNKIYDAATNSGFNPQDIIIVCISKNRILEEIYQVLDAGIEHIGESRVQEAQDKYAALSEYAKEIDCTFDFHMVGHLQTNKVNKAVGMFDLIQSVDSLKLAQKISEVSKEKNINTDILIEVNTSGEDSKFGVGIEETAPLLRQISKLENIYVRGLMTIAPLSDDQEESRPYFRKLRELRDQINEIDESSFREKINMDFLSMGMSQDYEVAVSEGANMLRIGTAIFEGEL